MEHIATTKFICFASTFTPQQQTQFLRRCTDHLMMRHLWKTTRNIGLLTIITQKPDPLQYLIRLSIRPVTL